MNCSQDGFLSFLPVSASGNVRYLKGCANPFFLQRNPSEKKVLLTSRAPGIQLPFDKTLCLVREGFEDRVMHVNEEFLAKYGPFLVESKKEEGHQPTRFEFKPEESPFVRILELKNAVKERPSFRVQVFPCTFQKSSLVGCSSSAPWRSQWTEKGSSSWVIKDREISRSYDNSFPRIQEFLVHAPSIKLCAACILDRSLVLARVEGNEGLDEANSWELACCVGEKQGTFFVLRENGERVRVSFENIIPLTMKSGSRLAKKNNTAKTKSSSDGEKFMLVQIFRQDLELVRDEQKGPVFVVPTLLNEFRFCSTSTKLVPVKDYQIQVDWLLNSDSFMS